MNCHGGNNEGQNNHENGHKGGHSKHMLLMVLCCAIPIVLLLLLPVLRINNLKLRSILPFAALLLCPLMHIVMMPMMFRKDKGGNNQNQDPYVKQIDDGKGGLK